MKLDELVGIKKFKNLTTDEILTYIKKEFGSDEIKVLGTGANAAALQIGNYAYKFWMIDDAYSAFIDYVLKNQDNVLLPKVHSKVKSIPAFFLKHEDAPARINYIKMEVLDPYVYDISLKLFDNDEWSVPLSEMCEMAYRWVTSEGTFTSWLRNNARHPNRDERIEPFSFDALSDEMKLWFTTVWDIGNLLPGSFLDIHADNVMSRNGKPVIIDPIADDKSVKLNWAFKQFNNKIYSIRSSE